MCPIVNCWYWYWMEIMSISKSKCPNLPISKSKPMFDIDNFDLKTICISKPTFIAQHCLTPSTWVWGVIVQLCCFFKGPKNEIWTKFCIVLHCMGVWDVFKVMYNIHFSIFVTFLSCCLCRWAHARLKYVQGDISLLPNYSHIGSKADLGSWNCQNMKSDKLIRDQNVR